MQNPSQTNTGPLRPTKNPRRVTQVPLRPMECSHGQIEDSSSPAECPLRPAQGMVTGKANKGSSPVIKGLFKPNSGLQLTQTCKGNSQANSGPAQADKGPQTSMGLSLWPTKCHLSIEGPS